MDDMCLKSPIISLEELLGKKHEFIPCGDALQDVTPPQWSSDVVNGKIKVVVGT